jgi:hypothetical protein
MQHILDTVGHLEAARSSLLNAMHDATAVESLLLEQALTENMATLQKIRQLLSAMEVTDK